MNQVPSRGLTEPTYTQSVTSFPSLLAFHTSPCAQWLSHIQLFATLWIVACQAPLSMGFFRQEYWSGFPVPPPAYLPNPGVEPESPNVSLLCQTDSLPLSHLGNLTRYNPFLQIVPLAPRWWTKYTPSITICSFGPLH